MSKYLRASGGSVENDFTQVHWKEWKYKELFEFVENTLGKEGLASWLNSSDGVAKDHLWWFTPGASELLNNDTLVDLILDKSKELNVPFYRPLSLAMANMDGLDQRVEKVGEWLKARLDSHKEPLILDNLSREVDILFWRAVLDRQNENFILPVVIMKEITSFFVSKSASEKNIEKWEVLLEKPAFAKKMRETPGLLETLQRFWPEDKKEKWATLLESGSLKRVMDIHSTAKPKKRSL